MGTRLKTLHRISAAILFVFGVVGAGILVLEFFHIFIHAFSQAINFSGYPTNGAFQLFNPLRRLADGQVPGSDFQFFHGLGTLFIHYPVFLLFGKDLFASEMARYLLSPILFSVGNFLFFFALRRKFSLALFAAAILVLIQDLHFIHVYLPANSLMSVRSIFPLITAALLILFLHAQDTPWYTKQLDRFLVLRRLPLFELLASILIAITFFISVEHGIASFLGFVIAYFFFFPGKNIGTRFRHLCVFVAAFILTTLVLFIIFCGLDAFGALHFALLDLPADQFWYFGAPPNRFITSMADFWSAPQVGIYLRHSLIFIGVGLIARFCIPALKKQSIGILFILFYGLFSGLPLLGYYGISYLDPLARVLMCVWVWVILCVIPEGVSRIIAKWKPQLPFVAAILSNLIFIGVGVFYFHQLAYKIPNISGLLTEYLKTGQQDIVKHSGVYLSPTWQEHYRIAGDAMGISSVQAYPSGIQEGWQNGVNTSLPIFFVPYSAQMEQRLQVGDTVSFFKSGKRTITAVEVTNGWMNISVDGAALDPTEDGYPRPIFLDQPDVPPIIWSTYASLLEAENGSFQPSGEDYIIHALGKQGRQEYLDDFRQIQPDYVTTIRRNFFQYETWVVNESWDFYRLMLNNYTAITRTPYAVVWEKNKTWTEEEPIWIDVPVGAGFSNATGETQIDIPVQSSAPNAIVEVQVEYAIDNPMSWLPYIGKLPRYLISPFNTASTLPISVPPYQTTFRFPLLVQAGQIPRLQVDVAPYNLYHSTFEVTRLQYRLMPLSEVNTGYFFDL